VITGTIDWQRQVVRLVAEGDRHAHQGENAEALSCYVEALDLVPEPRGDHEVSGRIFDGLRRVLGARGDLGDGMELLLATRPGLGPTLAGLAGRGDWVDW
jgi:hypothetical protein